MHAHSRKLTQYSLLRRSFASLVLCLLAFGVKPALANDNARVNFAQTMVVEENETAGDLVCFLCAIEVHGNVQGDVVSFLGGVKSDAKIDGDLVSFLGNVTLSRDAAVSGQVVVLGGNLRKAPGVQVQENQVVFPAAFFLIPLIFLAAILWGISRLLRRRPIYFYPMR